MGTNDRHQFFLDIEDGTVSARVLCLYDRTDMSRPCWPYVEGADGGYTERADPPQSECTYSSWVDNVGAQDLLDGRVSLPCDVEVEWEDGGLLLHLKGVHTTPRTEQKPKAF